MAHDGSGEDWEERERDRQRRRNLEKDGQRRRQVERLRGTTEHRGCQQP